jgi:hypothetical protein
VTAASRLPLLVSSKIAPPSTSTLCVHSRLPGARQLPHCRARSALAVSHDSDGLLHTELCGFVAPRYRPWGSPGFKPTADVSASRPTLLRGEVHPSKLFPLWQPRLPVTRALSPPAVGSAFTEVMTSPQPQGFLRHRVRCSPPMLPPTSARCSLGLLFDFQLSLTPTGIASRPLHQSPKRLAAHHRSGRSTEEPSGTLPLRRGP